MIHINNVVQAVTKGPGGCVAWGWVWIQGMATECVCEHKNMGVSVATSDRDATKNGASLLLGQDQHSLRERAVRQTGESWPAPLDPDGEAEEDASLYSSGLDMASTESCTSTSIRRTNPSPVTPATAFKKNRTRARSSSSSASARPASTYAFDTSVWPSVKHMSRCAR